jgi:hypothetical protein
MKLPYLLFSLLISGLFAGAQGVLPSPEINYIKLLFCHLM